MRRLVIIFMVLLFLCSSVAATVVLPLYDPYAIHADGTDPLTANWAVGGFDITGIGTLGVGDITASATSGNVRIDAKTASAGIAVMGLWGHKLGADAAFGAIPFFNNEDSVAQILSYRTGADDAGDLRFQTQAASGALTTRLTISSTGNFDFASGTIDTLGAITGASLTAGTTGVRIEDVGGDYLSLIATDLEGDDRTLNFNVNGASQVLSIENSPTLDDWFDQSVKQAASPTFAGETISTTGEINFRDTDISIGSTLTDGILDMSADGSIRMFYDNADVGDATDGQSFYVYRRAAEVDGYLRLYTTADRFQNIDASFALRLCTLGTNRALISSSGITCYYNINVESDTDKLKLGAGQDSSIHYDGTNMVINPKLVGSGYLQVDGVQLATDKIAFTQTDLNEYIDSLADGYMDYGATTAHRFNTTDLVVDTINHRVGIGTNAPDSIFHIKANTPGTVGSHPAGQLIIQDPDDTVFGNVVITGYESDGSGNPDQQLWYLGSSSGSNTDITFLNRRNASLHLGTNGVSHLTILGNGNVGIGTTTPTATLQMGDDKLVAFDTNAGITASTTQSQGQGALTAQINEISTVANKDDTVTLPTAVTGVEIEIINNGVNTLLIFPASGDDLGLGANTAEELEANERVKFVAYTTTNWAKESTTEIIHAEIHDEDNTDAFVINDAGGDFHSYHTNGLASGDLADWTFDAGGAGTSHAITGIADAGGGDITVTTGDAHNLAVGDIISQTNLADVAYVGIFDVLTVPTGTTYTVTATYTATGTGTTDQAATLEADAVAAGVYSFAYYISGTLVGNNETFDFQLYNEATAVTGSKVRRKFGSANDFGSMSGGGVVAVNNGDKISFALSNEDSSANIILRNLTVVLIRL